MLPSPHRVVRARAVALDPARRTVQLADGGELGYEALVVATGTKLSPPGTMPGGGDKKDGVEYLRSIQGKLKAADEIVIIGGGAVGVRAFDSLSPILRPLVVTHVRARARRDGLRPGDPLPGQARTHHADPVASPHAALPPSAARHRLEAVR